MVIFFNILYFFVGYLIGSVNFAIIIGRKKFRKDVRQIASKNAGATNASRAFGKKVGFLIFVLDMLKVAVAIMICTLFRHANGMQDTSTLAAGLGCVIGHCWPVFFQFKGGKGAACTAGFVAFLNPFFWIVGAIGMIIILYSTKKMSIGSMTMITLIMIANWLPWTTAWPDLSYISWESNVNMTLWWVKGIYMTLIWFIVVFQHRENLKRLFAGKENTI